VLSEAIIVVNPEVKYYKRSVYTYFDLLSDVGGLQSGFV
jgi:hypothetical protein